MYGCNARIGPSPSNMTKFLALDASTEECSVALYDNDLVTSRTCAIPKSHAKMLLPLVDEVMQSSPLSLGDLDFIALTAGPGSFTGIRIGISVAQGLAYGAGLKLLPISSLAVLAQRCSQQTSGGESESSIIVPCLDARMKEIYWSSYRFQGGVITEIDSPRVSDPEVFNNGVQTLVTKNDTDTVQLCGHGVSVGGVIDSGTACLPELLPDAPSLASLVSSMADADIESACVAPAEIEPLYLRNEVTWEKRKRIRQPTL